MGISFSLRAVTTLSKQQWLVKGEPRYGECWLLQTVFFAEIDFLEKHLTPEKLFVMQLLYKTTEVCTFC